MTTSLTLRQHGCCVERSIVTHDDTTDVKTTRMLLLLGGRKSHLTDDGQCSRVQTTKEGCIENVKVTTMVLHC